MWKVLSCGIILTAVLQCVISGNPKNENTLIGGSDRITSPNYPEDYGKEANCVWDMKPTLERAYALKLTLKRLALFYEINGKRVCSGSYNFTINNEKINCTLKIGGTHAITRLPCFGFYSEPSCKFLDELSSCNRSRIDFPLTISYVSDGEENAANTNPLLGFEMDYSFIPCPAEIVTRSTTATTTTTTKRTTTQEKTEAGDKPSNHAVEEQDTSTTDRIRHSTTTGPVINNKKEGTSQTTARELSEKENRLTPTKYAVTATVLENSGEAQILTPEIIGAIVASAVTVLAVIILALCCYAKRTKSIEGPNSDSRGELLVFSNNSVKITSGQPMGQKPNPKNESPTPVYSVINDDAQTGAGVYSTIATGTSHASLTETPMYSTIDSLSTDVQPHHDQSATNQLDAEITYCAVDSVTKESFRYQKSMVHNVLYGTTQKKPDC